MKIKSGFTLIELLVAITIMMLLMGAGIAAFINFNEKQQVLSAAKELQGYLRAAQAKARVSDKPADCDSLQAYAIRGNVESYQVSLVAICSNQEINVKTYELNPSVKLDQAIDISFLGLHGGVTGASDIAISGNSLVYEFTVNTGGGITEGDFVTE